MAEDIVRVMRIIEYVGPRPWVESTLRRSIHGTYHLAHDKRITAAILGDYPEVLEQARAVDDTAKFPSKPEFDEHGDGYGKR
jgi:hypothetical protein